MVTTTLPWTAPPTQGSTVDDRLAWYVEVARLAPSKHNSQPWRFVRRDGALLLWPDLQRALPLSDPMNRELLLSCGAAVQLAVVAAQSLGHSLLVSWLPEAGSTLLARLTEGPPQPVRPDAAALLAAVAERRTDRGPLDASVLSRSLGFELQAAAFDHVVDLRLVVTPAERTTLADLVTQADRMLVRDGGIDVELASWQRVPSDQRRDGVPVDHTRGAAASYRAEFVQRDFGMGHARRPAMDGDGPDAPLIAVLCTEADQALDWLVAGRALASVLLQAQVRGAHASYLNQPCEVPSVRHALRSALGLTGHPQVVLRIGAGSEVSATPRREARQVLTRDDR